ncbi:hypothetical protein [Pontibacter litorisediminis]|uniref:hypothetical protein n=1 Tax=Pontibacter litorisediminis TaxID=1846260 RepID=UPI0023ECB106|nr:hypothetical protein [Pontibacter litorisediminis]
MAFTFRNIWLAINSVLTTINSVLLAVILGGSLYNHKKKKHIKIPLIANIILLLVLGIAAGAYIYQFFITR